MIRLPPDASDFLYIHPSACFEIETFRVQVEAYLAQAADVYYFRVGIQDSSADRATKPGLLRVGALDGNLEREKQLRQVLESNKLISKLLAEVTNPSVLISTVPVEIVEPTQEPTQTSEVAIREVPEIIQCSICGYENPRDSLKCSACGYEFNSVPDSESISPDDSTILEEKQVEPEANPAAIQITDLPLSAESSSSEVAGVETEYLDEVIEDLPVQPEPKLLFLSYLPENSETLEDWLNRDLSLEDALLISTQVCQLFLNTQQQQWSFIQLLPQFIYVCTPIQFYDLTSAYPINESLKTGIIGGYSPPEVAFSTSPVDETMSSYVVASLLYQAIHKKLPSSIEEIPLPINPIPQIYQILRQCLSSAEDRFPLAQLRDLLVETRQRLRSIKIEWEIASDSTVGLSPYRLQNEDNYGIKHQDLFDRGAFVLAAVADGIGGMSEGEVASHAAITTLLETSIPHLRQSFEWTQWLKTSIQNANEQVASQVREGGTTLSVVLAVGRELQIAHVGDSRIFLLRKKMLCQLSEDHSRTAGLLANGQISYEESLDHADRNVLTRSLGARRSLSEGYIQTLTRYSSSTTLALEDGDTLLLCSDGVWDLIDAKHLTTFFCPDHTLYAAVQQTIAAVLNEGGHDNATILALRCHIHPNS